jgi:hypothetical protein
VLGAMGLVGGLQLGLLNYCGQSLLYSLTGSGRAFMLATPSFLLNPLRMNPPSRLQTPRNCSWGPGNIY